ncbi:MAG: hypothetical protein M3O71_19885 [Bacteroidota bacterium]|nr:hypothetical protein [Bacteroidota bacterium]
MKLLLCFVFLTCFFTGAIAQPPPPANWNAVKISTWEKYNAKYDNPTYVVDGKVLSDSVSKRVVNAIDPFAITKISVLSGTKSKTRNVVYLTTATEKIAAYQKKFGAFSKAYADYLEAHQHRDGNFFYTINAKTLSGGRADIVDELYNIPAEKIESVYFSLQAVPNIAMIEIRTKQ